MLHNSVIGRGDTFKKLNKAAMTAIVDISNITKMNRKN